VKRENVLLIPQFNTPAINVGFEFNFQNSFLGILVKNSSIRPAMSPYVPDKDDFLYGQSS
jgi:hypothetical protein